MLDISRQTFPLRCFFLRWLWKEQLFSIKSLIFRLDLGEMSPFVLLADLLLLWQAVQWKYLNLVPKLLLDILWNSVYPLPSQWFLNQHSHWYSLLPGCLFASLIQSCSGWTFSNSYWSPVKTLYPRLKKIDNLPSKDVNLVCHELSLVAYLPPCLWSFFPSKSFLTDCVLINPH